jgi:hypothetical protein
VGTYYGSAVIEFENSLKASEAHALEQLWRIHPTFFFASPPCDPTRFRSDPLGSPTASLYLHRGMGSLPDADDAAARRRRVKRSGARVTAGHRMLPTWLQYLQAGAVVLIPLVGAWIAWQQVQIARVKLRFDLYDKRFAVFEAVRKLVGEAITHDNVSASSLNAYTLGTADAEFLFDGSLSKYLRELFKHASMLSTLKYAIESSPVGSAQREDMVRIGRARKPFGSTISWTS